MPIKSNKRLPFCGKKQIQSKKDEYQKKPFPEFFRQFCCKKKDNSEYLKRRAGIPNCLFRISDFFTNCKLYENRRRKICRLEK